MPVHKIDHHQPSLRRNCHVDGADQPGDERLWVGGWLRCDSRPRWRRQPGLRLAGIRRDRARVDSDNPLTVFDAVPQRDEYAPEQVGRVARPKIYRDPARQRVRRERPQIRRDGDVAGRELACFAAAIAPVRETEVFTRQYAQHAVAFPGDQTIVRRVHDAALIERQVERVADSSRIGRDLPRMRLNPQNGGFVRRQRDKTLERVFGRFGVVGQRPDANVQITIAAKRDPVRLIIDQHVTAGQRLDDEVGRAIGQYAV